MKFFQFSAILFIMIFTSCAENQTKFQYKIESLEIKDLEGQIDKTVTGSEVADTVGVEYIKGAIKYVNPDKQETILIKQGESDMYVFNSPNQTMSIFAPHGADSIKSEVVLSVLNKNVTIKIKLRKLK